MSNEELIHCPKGCGTRLPVHLMHEHLNNCKGASQSFDDLIQQIPQAPTISLPPPPKPYVEPQRVIKDEVIYPSFCPKCGTEFIINEFYKVCIKCKKIKIRPKMFWWIILRYGMMIFWLALFIGFIFGITSYHKIYG